MRFTILVQPYLRRRGEDVKNPGASSERYQDFLQRLKEQMIFADNNGYGGFCMTEHHMQIEGIETTVNPIMLDLFVAQHTKNLVVGQLGMALTAHNPMKLAEDLALLDHMTQGRCFYGFVRGNTPRWLNTFSQHLDISTSQSDKSEVDKRNRRLFYEAFEIIKQLWTQDLVSFQDGEFWQIPPKNIPWEFPPTKLWGAGTEIDENGELKEVGLVPKPYTRPHPELWTPFSWSMETACFAAKEGIKLASFVAKDEFIDTTIEVYTEEAAKHGRTVTPADMMGIGGHLTMGRTQAKADEHYAVFEELFNTAYNAPPYHVPMGRVWKGTGQETLDTIAKFREEKGIDNFFLWHHVGYYEQEEELEMLETFSDEVIKKL